MGLVLLVAFADGSGLIQGVSDKRGMVQRCEREINKTMLTPATADYHLTFSRVPEPGFGGQYAYDVSGYVDFENGFSALIRKRVQCSGAPSDRAGHFTWYGAKTSDW